jgi:hypothetical protein
LSSDQLDVKVNRLSLADTIQALPLLDFAGLGFDNLATDPAVALPHHLDAYCNPYRSDNTACVVRKYTSVKKLPSLGDADAVIPNL